MNDMSNGSIKVGGKFAFELVRDGKVVDVWEDANLIVNEGLNHILGAVFNAGTQVTTWYVGLFEGNYTPVAADVHAGAGGFATVATECTAYTEAGRQEYVEAAPSGQSITNSASKATFSINATKTIYGAFLASVSTKGSTGAGTLMAAARFASARSVQNGDQLLITYTIAAAST